MAASIKDERLDLRLSAEQKILIEAPRSWPDNR